MILIECLVIFPIDLGTWDYLTGWNRKNIQKQPEIKQLLLVRSEIETDTIDLNIFLIE